MCCIAVNLPSAIATVPFKHTIRMDTTKAIDTANAPGTHW